MLGPLVAFVAATDLDRAREFYEGVLGLELTYQDSFACAFDGHGVALRVTAVERVATPGYTVLGWEVEDIERVVDELVGRGVRFRRYEGMTQDERGIWTSPSGARIAWFSDPDGNVLSITGRAG